MNKQYYLAIGCVYSGIFINNCKSHMVLINIIQDTLFSLLKKYMAGTLNIYLGIKSFNK